MKTKYTQLEKLPKSKKMNLKIKSISMVLIVGMVLIFNSCGSSDEDMLNTKAESEWKCGVHNGKQLYTGPQGGCYYYNSNGNKTYVERKECAC